MRMFPYRGICPYISLHIQIPCKCTNPMANKHIKEIKGCSHKVLIFLLFSKELKTTQQLRGTGDRVGHSLPSHPPTPPPSSRICFVVVLEN